MIVIFLLFVIKSIHSHPINQQLVEYIRNQTTMWTVHDAFTNPLRDRNNLTSLLGALSHTNNSINIPEHFDSRSFWPNCDYSVQDQQSCGSCVYFSAAVYLGQRFCIATNNSINLLLSPQYIIDCDSNLQDRKCQGSYLDSVNSYLVNYGTTSKSCTPYISGNGFTYQSCQKHCQDQSTIINYKCNQLTKFSSPQSIQQEILLHGPVQAQLSVFQDFFNYKSGIYFQLSSLFVGGHAVVILGWGIDNQTNTNYWIAQNQWGSSWGENGFFRIAFGQCGIDSNVYSCIPQITQKPIPTPIPTNKPIDCQAQNISCLKSGTNVSFCNSQFYSCSHPK